MPFFPCLLPIRSQTLLQVDKYILAYIYTKYMLQKRNKQQQKTFAFFFFLLHCAAYRILAPQPATEPVPQE